jgi:uncharacterized protein YdeI (YjbR/CyaY-like superfamily)
MRLANYTRLRVLCQLGTAYPMEPRKADFLMIPTFFATPEQFRAWLTEHHETESELWVGFHKRGTGRASMTWPEAVDEALCVGWIDAVRKSIDAESYVIRFTKRRPGSVWSNVNVARVAVLIEAGRMQPAGLAAFAARKEARSGIYSYEQAGFPEFLPEHERQFRENQAAWEYFQSRPGWYRKSAIWSLLNAKRDETKIRRLAELIDCSARGETVPKWTRPGAKTE